MHQANNNQVELPGSFNMGRVTSTPMVTAIPRRPNLGTLPRTNSKLRQTDQLIRTENSALMRANTELKKINSDIKGNVLSLKRANLELTRVLSRVQGNNSALIEANSELRSVLSEARKNNSALIEANSELTSVLSEARKNNSALIEANSKLTSVISEIRGNRSTLMKAHAELKKINLEARHNNSALIEANSELTSVLSEARKNNSKLEERNLKLSKTASSKTSVTWWQISLYIAPSIVALSLLVLYLYSKLPSWRYSSVRNVEKSEDETGHGASNDNDTSKRLISHADEFHGEVVAQSTQEQDTIDTSNALKNSGDFSIAGQSEISSKMIRLTPAPRNRAAGINTSPTGVSKKVIRPTPAPRNRAAGINTSPTEVSKKVIRPTPAPRNQAHVIKSRAPTTALAFQPLTSVEKGEKANKLKNKIATILAQVKKDNIGNTFLEKVLAEAISNNKTMCITDDPTAKIVHPIAGRYGEKADIPDETRAILKELMNRLNREIGQSNPTASATTFTM